MNEADEKFWHNNWSMIVSILKHPARALAKTCSMTEQAWGIFKHVHRCIWVLVSETLLRYIGSVCICRNPLQGFARACYMTETSGMFVHMQNLKVFLPSGM